MKPDDLADDEATMMRTLHRAAADRVDPDPDPHVRAAVLAAAARAVDAKLRDAASGFVPDARHARRWPRSVAALLMVSVTTGLLATFAMRESPERITTIATAPSIAVPEPSADKAVPRIDAESIAGSSSEPRPAPPAQAPPSVPQEPAPRASGRVDPSRRPATPVTSAAPSVESRPSIEPDRSDAEGPPSPAAPPRPAVDAPATASALRARPDPTAADATAANTNAANASAGRASSEPTVAGTLAEAAPEARAGAAMTPVPAASKATLYRGRRVVEPATPEAWVERIVQLRAGGQEVDADRELEALRLRYPAFEVPARALAHDGTR